MSNLKKNQEKSLLCFDLDGTLYPGNTSMDFYKYMLKIKAISKMTWPLACFAYLSYRFSFKNITFLHNFVHKRILSKTSAHNILRVVPEFIKKIILPNLRKKLTDQIKAAQADGHLIALLSSSPDFIVNEVAALLDINLTLASTYPIGASDRFCREIGVIRGQNKALWIGDFLKTNPIYNQVIAYSDSMEDLPMLLMADIKYAVYPDTSLLNISLNNGWQLILS